MAAQSLGMDNKIIEDKIVNQSSIEGPWQESLFGCFDDMGICCCGFWCLPCLFGDNAEKIDGSSCVGMSLLYWLLGSCYVCWVPHMMKRKALRQKYRLRPEPCNDCLATLCCSGCAVCQEARELKAREGPQHGIVPIRQQPAVAYRK